MTQKKCVIFILNRVEVSALIHLNEFNVDTSFQFCPRKRAISFTGSRCRSVG